MLLPGISGAAFLFKNRRKHDSVVTDRDPVIVLMDTTAEGGIYRKENIGNGGSNAKDVAVVLQEKSLLPSRSLHEVPINYGWANTSYVLSLHPDLVIIHRSAFFHTINAILKLEKRTDPEKWQVVYDECDRYLRMFIVLIGTNERRAKFLVYSRGTDTKWLEDGFQDEWKNTLETDLPELKDRVFTMTISRYQEGSFFHPETHDELRAKVIKILNLSEISESEKTNSPARPEHH